VATKRALKPIEAHKKPVHRVVAHPLEAGVFATASMDGTAW